MSRCSKIRFACLLAALSLYTQSTVWTAATADEQNVRAEIVYRANLGRADDVKLLVKEGASPDQTDAKGTPIIALAAVRSDPEGINVIKALVSVGVNINATDPNGQNALFYAAKAGNVDVVKVLMQNKIDMDAIDAEGNTARTVAAHAGHQDIIDAMDDFITQRNAKTAADAAKAQKMQQEAARAVGKIQLNQSRPGEPDTPALIPITDQASKAQAEAIVTAEVNIDQALGTPVETSEAKAPVSYPPPLTPKDTSKTAQVADSSSPAETSKEPFEIDEKKLEAAGAAAKPHAESPPTPLTPAQQEQFDTIIKTGIPHPATAPATATNATEPAKTSAAASSPAAIAAAVAASTEPAHATAKAPAAIIPPVPASPPKTPEQLAAEAEKAAQAKKAKEEADKKRQQEIRHMAYDLAYHTCSFQYWAYCLEVRQSSELGSEELTIAVQTQKDAVEAIEKKMLVDYHLPNAFYDNITKSAQLRIYNQLNQMPSHQARHENGVGKMDDMENRCEEIGRQWGFPASIKPEPPPPRGKGIPYKHKGGR